VISFKDFWVHYLRAHSYFATVLGISGVSSSVIWLDPWPAAIALGSAYGLAIGAHRLIERNHPLILTNPVWGAVSDLRMCLLAFTGRLDRELLRHGVPARRPPDVAGRSWGARAGRRFLGFLSASR
jgi:hypothetical protein